VIAAFDAVETRTRAESGEHRVQEVWPGERVARPLHEEHGHRDLRQVAVAELLRLAGGMEGVGQEDEAVRGRSRRHHLGGDPPPHRTATVNELLAPERGPRVLSDGAGRGLQHRGGIGAALPALRVEEVVEDDASAGAGERVGESNEGGLTPVSSRPVPEDDRGPALPVKRGAHLPARRPDPDLPHGPSIAAGHPAPAQGGTLSRSQRRAPSVYEAWYGLAEKPFNLTPDPKYLYLSRRHAEAFAHLEFGQRERGGFILLTGEVGTGKTTLARYFLGKLPDNTATAVVVYPALTAAELLRSILEDLHVPAESTSLKDLVDSLHGFLLEARAQRRNVILLIDEAQALSAEVLEQVRLISNLETDTEKLIQIVLLGQSELRELLSRRDLRQLAQRVTARYHLDGLSRTETEEYIRHRLQVAGGEGKVRMTLAALNAVHELSGGIPRIVNLVCDRSLLAGYVAATRTITVDMVRRAAAEVQGEEERRRWKPQRMALLGSGMVLAAALAVPLILPRTLQAPTPPPGPTAPPTTVAVLPISPPFSERLETAVLESDRLGSFRYALARLEGLWDRPYLQRTGLRTSLEQVRRLDLPAVLEMFHPGRKDTCFLALVGLDGDTAVVALGDGPPLKVPASQLDQLWTREAIFLWPDDGRLVADPRKAEAWTRDALERLGYARGPSLGLALAEFQRDSQLIADGVVGARTLMTLYSRGSDARPRLKSGSPS
jgi:general secretion pathway protein A